MPISANVLKQLQNNDPKLVELSFPGQTLNEKDLVQLTRALAKNTVLKKLRLNNHDLKDKSIELIATWLADNTSLESLNLDSNHFSFAGVQHLAKALHKNRTLKELHLFANEIFDEGLREFLNVLQENTSIKLYLYGNPAKMETHQLLHEKMQSNRRKSLPSYQFIQTLAEIAKARSPEYRSTLLQNSPLGLLPDEQLAYIFSFNIFSLKKSTPQELQQLALFLFKNWRFLINKDVRLTREVLTIHNNLSYRFFFDRRDKGIQKVLSICTEKNACEQLDSSQDKPKKSS